MSKQPVRAHLLDTLLADIILPPLPAGTNYLNEEEMFQHNAALRPILDGATCIEATNVARFFDGSYLTLAQTRIEACRREEEDGADLRKRQAAHGWVSPSSRERLWGVRVERETWEAVFRILDGGKP